MRKAIASSGSASGSTPNSNASQNIENFSTTISFADIQLSNLSSLFSIISIKTFACPPEPKIMHGNDIDAVMLFKILH